MTLEVKQCIQNEVASLSDTIASLDCKDDETLTCSKLASYAQTNELHCQGISASNALYRGHDQLLCSLLPQ